jgi:mRNA interferase RelE/StbE
MKAITYTGAARRCLRKLPAKTQHRIKEKLAEYAVSGTGDVLTLRGRKGSRLRIGEYRVIFVETATEIVVLALGHRRDVYR